MQEDAAQFCWSQHPRKTQHYPAIVNMEGGCGTILLESAPHARGRSTILLESAPKEDAALSCWSQHTKRIQHHPAGVITRRDAEPSCWSPGAAPHVREGSTILLESWSSTPCKRTQYHPVGVSTQVRRSTIRPDLAPKQDAALSSWG